MCPPCRKVLPDCGFRFLRCTLKCDLRVESIGIPMWRGFTIRGREMERMSDYEWFCANCLRMVDVLSRHGRCPYCDSNAVDVAYRWRRPEASGNRHVEVMTAEFATAHN